MGTHRVLWQGIENNVFHAAQLDPMVEMEPLGVENPQTLAMEKSRADSSDLPRLAVLAAKCEPHLEERGREDYEHVVRPTCCRIVFQRE